MATTVLSKLLPFTSPGRSSARPPIHCSSYLSHSSTEESIENLRSVIDRWDVSETALFHEDRSEAHQFLQSVENLQAVMQRLIELDANSGTLLHAHRLMEAAMKRLGIEFCRILSSDFILDSDLEPSVSGRYSATSSVSYHTRGESMSEDDFSSFNDDSESVRPMFERADSASTLADLKAIADCMIAAGYGKECIILYKSVRKSIADEELNRLGITTDSFSKNQRKRLDWEVLEKKIKSWLSAMRVAARSIFRRERILSSRVFPNSPKIRKACYCEITKDSEVLLFRWAENLARYLKKQSPDRIFHALDMYKAITSLWPELEWDFSSDSTAALRSHCVNALLRLRKTMRRMLMGFESLIQKDSSKTIVPGGGVHPLTRFAMNYLTVLGDYGEVLQDVVADWPLKVKAALPAYFLSTGTVANDEANSATSTRLAWLILVLLSKLDVKAELYRGDVALSYLFLANNLQYIVVKVRDSYLRHLLGREWMRTHESKVRRYSGNYERIGWSHAFSLLPDLSHPAPEISLDEAGNVFRSFNAAFSETYREQATWLVPDPNLRDQIRASLKSRIGPQYRAFYWTHGGPLRGREEFGDPIIRFAPEDVENYLSELFSGPGGAGRITSSSESSDSSLARSVPVKM